MGELAEVMAELAALLADIRRGIRDLRITTLVLIGILIFLA